MTSKKDTRCLPPSTCHGWAHSGVRPTCKQEPASAERNNVMTTTKELRPDQVEAVGKLTAALSQDGADRCQYVAACATGKTLVSQRVSEALVPDGLTVVAVPTIALLSQTLHTWLGDATPGAEFTYLAICSDPEVEARASGVSSSDEVAEEGHFRDEFNGAVCIELDDIKAHIKAALSTGRTVAFSTHASIGRLGQALDELGESANLLIVDEAHRAAAVHPEDGREGSSCLGEVVTGTFPAARRLFATATPRIIHIDHNRSARGREDEVVRYSMDDDPAGPFGTVAYQLGFAEAVELGLLVPYEVVVQITSSDETAQALATGQLLDMGGERIPADRLATYSGVARAAHEHDLRHVLTLHERVSSAEEFAKGLDAVARWLYPDENVRADSVSAKHATHERDAKFHAFAPEAFPAPNGNTHKDPADRAFLSNVRICTEGIDIKAIDGVAFVDPRQSVVDIAQAVGRAMRRWTDPTTGQEKEQGVVIVPVVVPPDTSVEEHMASTGWKTVQGVLEALCAVDDRLQAMLTTSLVRRDNTRDNPTASVACPGCGNILLRSDSNCPWCDPEPVVALAGAAVDTSESLGKYENENGSAPATGNGDVHTAAGAPGRAEPSTQLPSSAPRIVIAGDAKEFIDTISLSVLGSAVSKFDAKVRACAEWLNVNRRTPSKTAEDEVERRHAEFLSRCRQGARGKGPYANTLTAARRAMLDRYIPGWEKTRVEASFEDRVPVLGEWVTANGRWPLRGSTDPIEKSLGAFLDLYRQAARGTGTAAKTFTPERRALLDKHCPGWNDERPRPRRSA